jgi:lipoprotein-anchoring transpeptidase ErfK/SrfK
MVVAVTALGATGWVWAQAHPSKPIVAKEVAYVKPVQAKQVVKPAPAPVVQSAAATTPAVKSTPAPTPPPPTTPCSDNTLAKTIIVSISQQHMWACAGSSVALDSAVTTGAYALSGVDDATPTGTFHIYSKQTNLYLTGSDIYGSWHDYVQYWMPFYSDYGFHDASWQTFPFGGSAYSTQGSHGCVHLPTDTAAWVYNWAPIGTAVTIKS